MNELTPVEIDDLTRLESSIETGQRVFEVVGIALAQIRNRKLYRKDYHTFEAYCQQRWGWSRFRTYQLIEACEVVAELPEKLKAEVPNERVARELGKLPKAERVRTIKEIKARGEKLTAASVRPVPPVPKTPTARQDETGTVIPPKVLVLWDRCAEIQPHLSALSKIKSLAMRAQEAEDPGFAEVNFSALLAALSQARNMLKTVKPFAVCPNCQGLNCNLCRVCRGRGFISEFLWNSPSVRQSTKEIRFKSRKT
jgi:hypothetical protein